MAPSYLVFFGPPGCGKGTQAKKLAAEFGLAQISTGELFRKHLANHTPLGLEAKTYMDRGALVPDEITIGMVGERLQEPDAAKGAIFDGYPRTGAQAQALDRLLAQRGAHVDLVVDFALPTEVSRSRLMSRQEGRADDSPEVIERRLRDHATVEDSVMPHYSAQPGLVARVDANRPIDDIYRDVRELARRVIEG